jgi:hypothetical protein
MKGHVPSPSNPIDRYMPRVQKMPFVSPPTQGEDRRVFEEEKRVSSLPLAALPDQLFLPRKSLGVFNEAKIDTAKIHHQKYLSP